MLQSMSVLHPYFWPKKTSLYHNLFLYSSVDKHWGGFNFLAIMDNTAANIHVKGFVWTHVLNFLGYILQGKIAGTYVNSMFSFLRNCQTFLKWLHHFSFSNTRKLQFLNILENTSYYLSFNYSHPSRCEVVSHYTFSSSFP